MDGPAGCFGGLFQFLLDTLQELLSWRGERNDAADRVHRRRTEERGRERKRRRG